MELEMSKRETLVGPPLGGVMKCSGEYPSINIGIEKTGGYENGTRTKQTELT